ncbi:MAG: VacJ family lipoprotein [Pseudomonadota bacterium]
MLLDLLTASHRPLGLLAMAAIALGGCTTSQDVATRTDGINDPYEQQNRAIHEFNKEFDTGIVRPLARGYATVIPVEVRGLVNNFSNNLDQPGNFVNSVLQADLRGAGLSSVRFVMNTTIGLGGLVDAASEFGIAEYDTDFGETLSVWGAGEGAFIELPVFGASTQRDATGLFVDFFTNPLTYATVDDVPERYVPPAATGLEVLDFRERFSATIDSVLYESVDSYAINRQIYLQNRRFDLGEDSGAEIDPFADPADAASTDIDPFADPFGDADAQ